MRQLLLRIVVVLSLVLIASGIFFEWVLVELLQKGDLESRLNDAFALSLGFDFILVGIAATALSWPLYRRIRRLQEVVHRQQGGELELRANFGGSDAIAQLAAAFDALADTNARHLENQRSLLRAVSHELRTPVARLRFALAELVSANKDERADLRERAESDIDELDALIAEILDYVRVIPGGAPRSIESFDLNELLASLEDEHPDATIIIDTPEQVPMEGEPRLLRRALSNILRNAVAYAQKLVTVTVTVEKDVRIAVLDDGPGLPPDADERLFLPFVRYSSTGVGLGSSIASAIAQRHGGTLEFSPRPPGTGAEFIFRLPRKPELQNKNTKV